MKKLLILLSLLFSVSINSNYLHAEIYKCKDQDGVINFTSVPCGEKAQGIKQAPKKKAELNPDGTKKTNQQIIAERIKREKEFIEASRLQKESENRRLKKLQDHENKIKNNCAKAKKTLATYQRSHYLYNKDKSGKKIILSDKERIKAEINAQREVSYWCRQ